MYISPVMEVKVRNLVAEFERRTGLHPKNGADENIQIANLIIYEINEQISENLNDGSFKDKYVEEKEDEQKTISKQEDIFLDEDMPNEEMLQKEEPKNEEPKKEENAEPEKMSVDKMDINNRGIVDSYTKLYHEIFTYYDEEYNNLDATQKEASKNFVVEFEGMMKEFFTIVMAPDIRTPQNAPRGLEKQYILNNLRYGVINEHELTYTSYKKEAEKLYTNDKELEEQMKANGTYTGDGICNKINEAYSLLEADVNQNGRNNLFSQGNEPTPFEALCQTYKVAKEHYDHLGFFAWIFAFSERKALKKAGEVIDQVKNSHGNINYANMKRDVFVNTQLKLDSKHDFDVYEVEKKEVPDYSEISGRKQDMEKLAGEKKLQLEQEKEWLKKDREIQEKAKKEKEIIEAQKTTKLARRLAELIINQRAKACVDKEEAKAKAKNTSLSEKEKESIKNKYIKEHMGLVWQEVGGKFGKKYEYKEEPEKIEGEKKEGKEADEKTTKIERKHVVRESKNALRTVFVFNDNNKVIQMMKRVDDLDKEKEKFPIHRDSKLTDEEKKNFVKDFMKLIDPEEERKKAFEETQRKEHEAEETLKQQIYDKQVEKYKIKQAEKEKQQEEENKKNGIEPKKKEENREPVEIDPNDLDDLEENFNFATFNFDAYINKLEKEPVVEVKAPADKKNEAPANENKEAPANENKEAPANDKNEAPVNEGNDESIPQP